MKQILLSFTFLFSAFCFLPLSALAQDRTIARGAEPGELYAAGLWYGVYNKILGPPAYDTISSALYHLTENGKKLTIQYSAALFANIPDPPDTTLHPQIIISDATPGVLYAKSPFPYPSLWVSFDYGKNWILREVNNSDNGYYAVNMEGAIYKYGLGGRFKSVNYGKNFYLTDEIVSSEPGLQVGEAYSAGNRGLLHTYDFYKTYTTIPIDSQFMFGLMHVFPDVYRGALPGEVYVDSEFPDGTYKVSFSADTGYTFRHVYVSEPYSVPDPIPTFMSDRAPGVFYIIRSDRVESTTPWGIYNKLCVEYYRDYGETLEATFCHEITKYYEYEEVICEHTTFLEAKIVNPNSVQLQWSNSADNIRGYHVYRNNVRITNYELRDNTYLDENLPIGNYEYYVRTYYNEGCVSDSSNHVKETIEVGVKEVKELEVILFPNPTMGELRITNYELRITDIEVFDMYGRKCNVSRVTCHENEIRLDISHLKAGIYFVRITTEKGIVMKKVVKM